MVAHPCLALASALPNSRRRRTPQKALRELRPHHRPSTIAPEYLVQLHGNGKLAIALYGCHLQVPSLGSWHATMGDTTMTPLYHMGVCESASGAVYVTTIAPLTLLEVKFPNSR